MRNFVLGLVFVVLIVFFATCGGYEMPKKTLETYSTIEVIEVQGMTCVIYKVLSAGGITCNWDEWEAK